MIIQSPAPKLHEPSAEEISTLASVWNAFHRDGAFPAFGHIESMLARDDIDAGETIGKLAHFFATHPRGGSVPFDNDIVALRIRGLASCGDPVAHSLADQAAKVLGYLAARQYDYIAPATTGEALRITSIEIAEAVGLSESDAQALYHVFSWDLDCRAGGSSTRWEVSLDKRSLLFRGVATITDYLNVDKKRIDAAPPVEVVISPPGSRAASTPTPEEDPVPLVLVGGLEEAAEDFGRGKYRTAVREAMHKVEVVVRERSGLPRELVGVDLVTQAFKKDGPLRDPAMESGEAEGVMQLFRGAFLASRNPVSHHEVEFSRDEALEHLALASLLLRQVARSPISS